MLESATAERREMVETTVCGDAYPAAALATRAPGYPHLPVGLSDTLDLRPHGRRVVPWGKVTDIVGLSDATRCYPVGRSDDSTS
jgi:hypothetical protein